MAHEITDWNLNPNSLWFIKITYIDVTFCKVELFSTQADAAGNTNLKGYNNSVSYDPDTPVILEPSAGVELSYFNDALSYHLKISGTPWAPSVIFKVNPFVDLPVIDNSIYRSASLIQRKAINEINLHTHIAVRRSLGIANHKPALQVGDVCRLTSTLRSMDVLTTIDDLTIIGTRDSLINQIGTVEYTDLNYG